MEEMTDFFESLAKLIHLLEGKSTSQLKLMEDVIHSRRRSIAQLELLKEESHRSYETALVMEKGRTI